MQIKAVIVALALVLVATACTNDSADGPSSTVEPLGGDDANGDDTGSDDTPNEPPVVELDWSDCDALECATLAVPLDHGVPDGEMIEIALARQRAKGSDRIGSLVFNPGGPGGSGIDYLTTAVLILPDEIQQRFDLVSFDPRGVGASTAVDCDLDWDDQVPLVETVSEWEQELEDTRTLLGRCPSEAIELAPHVGTNNAARDLDLIRAALGDEKLSYVGYSYGTRLGSVYAELFPENVRALVLDGALLPSDDFAAVGAQQIEGFDRAFENFAAACDDDPDCALADLGPTIEVFEGIRSELADLGSLEVDREGRRLTAGEFDLGVISALYSVEAWPFLAQALFTADVTGDGTLLQVLADNYLGREPDGTYTNGNEANAFINCADNPRRPTVDEVQTSTFALAEGSTYFPGFFRASTGCIGTPDPIDPIRIGPAEGSAPLLVLGNTGDPATPYEWAVELSDFLDNAVLYTVDAEGHTAYGSFECVAPIVNAYLIDLELPQPGGSCAPNDDADFFPPAGESDVDKLIAFVDCLVAEGIDIEPRSVADVLSDPTGEQLLADLDLGDPATTGAFGVCVPLLG